DDQPRLLARYFRCHSVFQSNVHVGDGAYGNLLLSRWPVESRHRISLRQGGRKPRGAQLVLIDSPEGLVHIVHLHLGLAERERHWQIDRLLGHMLFRSGAELPTLIVGDFNDWRNTLAGGALAAGGFRHVTSPAGHFRSFPAWLAMGSLDKAFVRGEVDVRHARMVRTTVARTASDHLPLVIDFHLG
ncbi:MAG: endonuclease, partial [Planctomycetia bacterium]|nr:endonuclease [Planctomycetia bacterium]